MLEQTKGRLAAVINSSTLTFGILGGIGYLLLVRYPYRIDYFQQINFDKIALFTLVSLIIAISCGITSVGISRGHRVGSALLLCVPSTLLLMVFTTPRLLVKSVLTEQNVCIKNVRLIESVKAEWAQRTGATNGTEVSWESIAPYFTNVIPKCPEGGVYNLGKIGEPVMCSIPKHQLPPEYR